ncbi:MAG: 3-deoxy-D-manno-octulosonic acid transferase [Aquabacterium sp.]|uniref:3-deoxy-D-manno-octulosonic acid transferase n=1 Tax=Aquabacterium sp. TaxID=1872578 RepID=UPI00271FF4F7|nr:3-deoxy-D-manno-octulosonic acid transferase [Aquabacterium sp.]MDO9002810.1 3-deoxy-D-manno-octulosonic acid transferase [Aquabacterium sp.]
MFKTWLAQQAYTLLLRLLVPAYLWRVWRRGRQEPVYRVHWPQRLGFYGRAHRQKVAHARSGRGPLIWLHAVSLGETLAAKPLLIELRRVWPGLRLVLTHGTATGREAGAALLQEGDVQTWLPYDTPGAVRRFLRLHGVRMGVLMETEIWPNVQREAARAGLPMVLANARLSEKSLRQALRLRALMHPAAQSLALVLAQTQADAERLLQAGAPRVKVCGNVKFDLTPSPELMDRGRAWAQASVRPIVLAAVTREGEEADLLAAWTQLHRGATDDDLAPRLVIVPRHPQRFDEVAALVAQHGLSLSRRSSWPIDGNPGSAALACQVWLGDSMGEMPAYYAAARVALLGGSFAPLGGQNLIEAAACGCPLVMGPHTFNFAQAAELSEAAGAAVRVSTFEQALDAAVAMMAPQRHAPMVANALGFALAHKGAACRMAEAMGDISPDLGDRVSCVNQ